MLSETSENSCQAYLSTRDVAADGETAVRESREGGLESSPSPEHVKFIDEYGEPLWPPRVTSFSHGLLSKLALF